MSAAQSNAPQPFRWDGEAMVPLRPRAADRQYVIGQVYTLEELDERSAARHKAFFAQVRECWKSLPDDVAVNFPTATALRKAALIATGWRDEQTEVFRSNAEARRMADIIRRYMASDAFPQITVSGCALVVLTAKSQACNAMNKADFDASSEAALNFLAERFGYAAGDIPAHEAA